ncbi:CUB domain-containing protein [Caerostris extrusa]|uniref:CUB domain-containing protein n=1 Tax=Caerostris extrusa TaxID=172846 RepID=A0AAV4U074_CAEEX|nr:CUB domain-containing protein [Caerostris extrusa]
MSISGRVDEQAAGNLASRFEWECLANSSSLQSPPGRPSPPPRSTGNVSNCGGTVTGVGGVIVSPGFPYYFPKDVECIWLLRVDYHMKIYIRVLKMQLYGSIGKDICASNCQEAEMTLYDGYSSISFNPKVLQKYCGDLRYFKNVEEQTHLSARNRLLLRFKTSAAQIMKGEDLDKNAVGFKIVWTAVDFKTEGS